MLWGVRTALPTAALVIAAPAKAQVRLIVSDHLNLDPADMSIATLREHVNNRVAL
jgi:hypothetical protein